MSCSTLIGVGLFDNEGGTAEINLSSLLWDGRSLYFLTLFYEFEKEEAWNA
jgi:hypothetical protein